MQSLSYPLTKRRIIPVYSVITFYAACAPIAVSGGLQHLLPIPSSVLLTCTTISLLFLSFIFQREMVALKEIYGIGFFMCLAIGLPALLSLIGVAYASSTIQSVEYVAFVRESLVNRLINLGLFSAFTILILCFIYKDAKQTTSALINGYTIGVGVLIAGGLWQFLHFTIGYPMPGFETRAYVHSVQSDVLFNFRLTSFTDEPSFFVPFLIDGLIIGGLILARKAYLLFAALAVIVLILSFSVSGYINLVVIVFAALLLLLSNKMISKKIIVYSSLTLIALLSVALIAFPNMLISLFMPVLGRLEGLFDVMHHSRLYMLVFPFIWLFDYSKINSFLGFGSGSYDFLARTKFLSHQGSLSGTSNNIFVDLLFEQGVFGGLLFTAVFIGSLLYLWLKRKSHLYYGIALLLWLHLGVTSMYRSDFASPRFWLIVLIVAGLTELARRKMTLRYKSTSSFLKAKVTS